jgi:hypothetical protein
MRRELLLVLVVAWSRWSLGVAAASPAPAAALDPFCGDGTCQTISCDPQLPGSPGDGCEENPSNCQDDCGWCGNGMCNVQFENQQTCQGDCGYCGDHTCQSYFENQSNCSTDCGTGGGGGGPTCGNGTCDGNEDCDSCPRDCSESCGICGDQYCAANEYGGGGSGHPPPCNVQTDMWCTYCETDCGGCNPAYCDPQVCADDYGRCRPCQSHSECFYTDQYCSPVDGTCHIGTACNDNTDCPATWTCTGNPKICVPPI